MHYQPSPNQGGGGFGGYDPDQGLRNHIDQLYARYDTDGTGTLGEQ